MTPEFLVVGHVVQDLGDGVWRPGGAATYAALLARNLGLKAAVLTSCADDFPLEDVLNGVEIRRVPSERTTQMRNVYEGGHRTQWLPQRAALLSAVELPEEWRDSRIVLIGPVAGEVDPGLAFSFANTTLVGAGAQGWLREAGSDGRVRPKPPERWNPRPVPGYADALFLSDEDIPRDSESVLEAWAKEVGVLAFTRGEAGADVWRGGERRHIDAFPSEAKDLTGAGDVFAAAFLVIYAENGDSWEAARFAAAASSLVIEGSGAANVPDRAAIERRLAANPGIVAR